MSPRDRRGPGGPGEPWWEYESAPPIPVTDGLVARSTRGAIGGQWWSKRFLAVMESMNLGGRLTRGRAYARKGQVRTLEVGPGAVVAVVQGSRVTPYRVRIGLPVFSELVWAKVEVALAEQALHSARLLAGEMPPDLEDVLARAGARLFPAKPSDLAMSCTCPDHAVPCKHVAAAFYLLAERFDDDPFLILYWRGRDRRALLDRLRALRGLPDGADPDPGDGSEEAGGHGRDAVQNRPEVLPGASRALAGRPAAVASDPVERFWTAEDLPAPPRHPDLPVDLLLRQLPAPPTALGGDRWQATLGRSYEALAHPQDDPAAD